MSWFRLDDKSWSHEKIVAVGNAAWGAWCRLGAYASDHLTDGRIPSPIAQLIATIEETEALIAHELLVRNDDGSYTIHDYLDYNPSAREVRKMRKSREEAGRRGGSKRAANAKQTPKQVLEQKPSNGQANAKQNSTPSRPDPVPIPSEEGERASAPPSRLSTGERHDASETYLECACRLSDPNSWAFSTRGEREIVANAVDAHGPKGVSAMQRRSWIAEAVEDWNKRDATAKAKGFAPMKFADWLREGRPIRNAAGQNEKPTPKIAARQLFTGHK